MTENEGFSNGRKNKMKKSILTAVFAMTMSTAFAFDSLSMTEFRPVSDSKFFVYTIGDGSQSYTAPRWITPFAINQYETTYELWYDIRTASEEMGYKYMNYGQGGSRGKCRAEPEENTRYQPVTMINWYDAVIWCNALSEISGFTPCYTYQGEILRDATDTAKLDLCECNFNCNGYRLPTESEWEFAARKTVSGYQSGLTFSGQIDAQGREDYSIPEGEVAWTDSNADRTHTVGTAGTPFDQPSPPQAGSGNPNGSGLFDMSGNVLEFAWDWFGRYEDTEPGRRSEGAEFGSRRVSRGGSWSLYTPFAGTGDRYSYDPNECYNYLGFRIARSL